MTKFNREDDKEAFAKAEPFVRAVLAFLIFTFRKSGVTSSIEQSYEYADCFIEILVKDLGND